MTQLKPEWSIEFMGDERSGLSADVADILSQEITAEIDKDVVQRIYLESTITDWYQGTWMNSSTVLFDKVIE